MRYCPYLATNKKARVLRRRPLIEPDERTAYEAVSAVTSARTFSARAVER